MKTVSLSALGLYTLQNEFTRPEGSAKECVNFDILKDGVYQTSRGFITQQRFENPTDYIFTFNGKNVLFSGSTLFYQDVNDVYQGFNSGFSGVKYTSSALDNLYFTDNLGIFKFDGQNDAFLAGVPRGLQGVGVSASTESIIPNNEQVSYRIVWGYKDSQNVLYLGAPSPRIIVENISGADSGADLTFYIPARITEGYFYQVYRSLPVAIGIEPTDELYLVEEVPVTDAEILAGVVNYQDRREDTSAVLYTSKSQQGIQGSNYEPPPSKDLTYYNNIMVYGNFRTRDRVAITISGSSQNNVFNFFNRTGDLTIGSPDILNVSSVANLRVGQAITDNTLFPDGAVIDSIVLPDTVIMSEPALLTNAGQALVFRDVFSVGAEQYYAGSADDYPNRIFEVFADIEDFSISLVNIINAISTDYSAYYNGIGDDDRGLVQIDADVYGSPFQVNSSNPLLSSPNLPFDSTFDDFSHAVICSKADQPEACLLGAIYPIGSREFPVKRVQALKDGTYIFKGDGIYKMTGSNPENMVIRRIDNNSILVGDRTLTTLDNRIFCFTEQGVSVVDQTGTQIISRRIENQLLSLSLPTTNFENVAFGVAYETDRKYYLFCNTDADDEFATQAFVYNYATDTFVTRKLDARAAIVNYDDDLLYVCSGNKVLQEKKTYTESDYVEDEFLINVISINGNTIDVSDVYETSVGDLITQDSNIEATVTDVSGNTITLDSPLFFLGESTVYKPIHTRLVFNVVSGGDPSIQKHFQDLIVTLGDCNSGDFQVSFFTANNCEDSFMTLSPKQDNGYGDCPFGEDDYGEAYQIPQNLRTLTPLEYSRSSAISLGVSHSALLRNLEMLGISLVFEPMDTRTRK